MFRFYTLILITIFTTNWVSGQVKTELNHFNWDAGTPEPDVFYAIGISIPGLPYEEAVIQATELAKIWLMIGIKTKVEGLYKFYPEELIKKDESKQFYQTFSNITKLSCSEYQFPIITDSIFQLEDGSVLVVLKGFRTISMSSIDASGIIVKYYSEEVSENDKHSYKMSYDFIKKNGIRFAVEQDNEQLSYTPVRPKLNIENNAFETTTSNPPDWFVNIATEKSEFLTSVSISKFSITGENEAQLADALITAYIKALFDMGNKIEAKLEFLKKQFTDEFGISDPTEDPYSQPMKSVVDLIINDAEISKLHIDNQKLYIQLRLRHNRKTSKNNVNTNE